MANFGGDDIDKVITGGIVFSGGAKKASGNSNAKVKTKAKKKENLYHGGRTVPGRPK